MRACSDPLRSCCLALVAVALTILAASANAQQSIISNWPADTGIDAQGGQTAGEQAPPGLPNTTVVPWTPSPKSKKSAGDDNSTHVTLVALLTQDGQRIDSGLVWRVYKRGENADLGRKTLVETRREASPVLRLPPGEYFVNAAFGRAHLTRRISVKSGVQSVEPFVLNAGGLRVTALESDGDPVAPNSVSYDILSDERDQFGNRATILSGARPGVIIRLNSGIYHIVSTYGDANARVSADVTVEAGKLTEATVTHSAAKVTFKLVTRAGGEALPDTQWSILDTAGEVIKESIGALPVHTLAPGTYTVTARSGGQVFRREFSVAQGDVAEVEVVMQ